MKKVIYRINKNKFFTTFNNRLYDVKVPDEFIGILSSNRHGYRCEGEFIKLGNHIYFKVSNIISNINL